MIKETKLYKILSFVHLIFTISIFLGISTIVSCGILFLPALAAVFYMGKELLFGRYNVNDGMFKTLFTEARRHIRMLRFLPAQILFVMQYIGIYTAGLLGMKMLQIILLSSGAFLLVYLFYICGYEIFLGREYSWLKVILAMFYRINYLLTLWILAVLAILFVQPDTVIYLLIAGGAIFLSVEVVIFLSLMSFKEASGLLEDYEEEMPRWYTYINNRRHK